MEESRPFMDQLAGATQQRGNPVVVGIDPRLGSLPDALTCNLDVSDPSRVAEAYRQFSCGIVDAVAQHVPAIKPQMAFFEQLGPAGMQALLDVIVHAQNQGLLVVLDGKRNDIGSTAEAYAQAYLGRRPHTVWGGDALTVSPYLGDDSLEPFVSACVKHAAGIFVLVKTSNPGGKTFQDLTASDKTIFEHVADVVERMASETVGTCGYGAVGAVAGATYPEQLGELRARMPHTWFLVPGFGAQGGGAADVAGAFDERGLGATINSSRGIIFAQRREPYSGRYSDAQWQEAAEAAALDMISALRAETRCSQLGNSAD